MPSLIVISALDFRDARNLDATLTPEQQGNTNE